jgi:hypothetical protein
MGWDIRWPRLRKPRSKAINRYTTSDSVVFLASLVQVIVAFHCLLLRKTTQGPTAISRVATQYPVMQG